MAFIFLLISIYSMRIVALQMIGVPDSGSIGTDAILFALNVSFVLSLLNASILPITIFWYKIENLSIKDSDGIAYLVSYLFYISIMVVVSLFK